MSIRDSHNRKVSFDTREELGHNTDKLAVMIGKLATRDSGARRQNRCKCDRHGYNQQTYQNKYRSDSGDRRQYRQDRGRPGYEQNYRTDNLRVTLGILTDRIVKESIEVITARKVMTAAGTGLENSHFPETLAAIEIGVQATVGPGQDQELVQIEIE